MPSITQGSCRKKEMNVTLAVTQSDRSKMNAFQCNTFVFTCLILQKFVLKKVIVIFLQTFVSNEVYVIYVIN